jgi:hypothetical protein
MGNPRLQPGHLHPHRLTGDRPIRLRTTQPGASRKGDRHPGDRHPAEHPSMPTQAFIRGK